MYYIEWAHQFGGRIGREEDGPSSSNHVWEILWKLNVPSKVKKIGWKVLRTWDDTGYGSTRKPTYSVSRQCPVCKKGAEDLKHLMFTCDRARVVWRTMGVHEIVEVAAKQDRSGSIILENILRDKRQHLVQQTQSGIHESILVGAWIYGGNGGSL